MADIAYSGVRPGYGRLDWRAIWAGAFIFYGIWAVFGALAVAIFATNASPSAGAPVMGESIGMAIWAVILTIIAMYVAGRQTSRLAGVVTRNDGIIHSLIMFGLSVVGLVLLVAIGGTAIVEGNTATASVHSPYVFSVISDLGWAGFVALFLGWIAAMLGGANGAMLARQGIRTEPRPMTPAA
jgi:hypothetical protein